ncbi:membrane protein [Clostridium acetobutylicum]|nr:membrane protein [Clostridium acetobutylicum]
MNSILSSFKKNQKGIILILIASICTTIGQTLWKMSAMHNMLYILIGFFFYGIGAVGMIIALKYGSFSVIHPMMSMGYVFTIIVSYILLRESVGFGKIIGVILIMFGVAFIGLGDE